MNWHTLTLTLCLSLTVAAICVFPFVPDPVMTADTFHTGDNREHRLGSMSCEAVTRLQNRLIHQARSASPAIRAHAIGRLITIYRKRTMIADSLKWLKIGLREFPDDPHIKNEEIEMQKIIRRNMAMY